MDPNKQIEMYRNGKCYLCEGNLTYVKEKDRKQCHNCLGHFVIMGGYPCFVSWAIEIEKKE